MALLEYPHINIEDYLILDNNSVDARYEYLDGELRMLAGGSSYHSIIAANMGGILHSLLRGNPCAVYNSDMRLQLSKSRYVYPDVMVSCDRRDQERSDNIHDPCIVIEVLSPSTEVIDRIKKLAYYRECPSIQEYVMVDSQKYLVDIYQREDKDWRLKTLYFQDTFILKSINAHILVKDIYEKISFQP